MRLKKFLSLIERIKELKALTWSEYSEMCLFNSHHHPHRSIHVTTKSSGISFILLSPPVFFFEKLLRGIFVRISRGICLIFIFLQKND